MRRRWLGTVIGLAALGAGLSGAAPAVVAQGADLPPCTTQVAFPQISGFNPTPAPNATPAQQSLIGYWQGVWEASDGTRMPTRLVVGALIPSGQMRGWYLWGDQPAWGASAGYERIMTDPVTPSGHFGWGSGSAWYEFDLQPDGTLSGHRDQPGSMTTTVTLTKCSWQ